jgi:hypothetical protein
MMHVRSDFPLFASAGNVDGRAADGVYRFTAAISQKESSRELAATRERASGEPEGAFTSGLRIFYRLQ